MSVSIKKICEMLEEAEMNLADKVDSAWMPNFDASISCGCVVISGSICGLEINRTIAIIMLAMVIDQYAYIRNCIDSMAEQLYADFVGDEK